MITEVYLEWLKDNKAVELPNWLNALFNSSSVKSFLLNYQHGETKWPKLYVKQQHQYANNIDSAGNDFQILIKETNGKIY